MDDEIWGSPYDLGNLNMDLEHTEGKSKNMSGMGPRAWNIL